MNRFDLEPRDPLGITVPLEVDMTWYKTTVIGDFFQLTISGFITMVIPTKVTSTVAQVEGDDIGGRDRWCATRIHQRVPFLYLALKFFSRLKPPLHHGHTKPEWHRPIMFTGWLFASHIKTQASTSVGFDAWHRYTCRFNHTGFKRQMIPPWTCHQQTMKV